VRELKNTVHRAFIMAGREVDLSAAVAVPAAGTLPPSGDCLTFAVGTPLAEAERQLIFATLNRYQGNKKKTAEVLGVSLKTLYNRLTEYRANGNGIGIGNGSALARLNG
jgi:DNA-binding NtrC family response regulator